MCDIKNHLIYHEFNLRCKIRKDDCDWIHILTLHRIEIIDFVLKIWFHVFQPFIHLVNLLLWLLDGDSLWAPAVSYLGGWTASVWIHPPVLPARLPHCLTSIWRSTAHQGGLTPAARGKAKKHIHEDVLGQYPPRTISIKLLLEWIN